MPHHDEDVVPDSTYPALEAPSEFQSQIPDHLLVGSSQTDRYIMEQMSIMRQYSDWSVKALLSTDRNVRLTNGKVRRAETNILALQEAGKSATIEWATIAKVVGIIVTVLTLGAALWSAFHG